MSTVFQLNPAQVGPEIAAKLNPEFAQAGFPSKMARYQQRITEYGNGTGNSQFGTMLTQEIPYDEATQAQLSVVQTAKEGGYAVPSDATLMDPAVSGPVEPWNLPYGQGGWGLDGSTPSPTVMVTTILFNDGGKVREVTGPVA